MSNERTDEFLSWRGRLDDPQGVPGQGLDDREATWERLMDKISETPRRRRFFGYRLAAACLLLALIPTVRLFHGRHAPVAATRPMELRRTASSATASAAETTPPATAIQPPVTSQLTTAPPTHRPAKTSRREEPIKLAGLTPPPITVSATPPDSAASAQIAEKPLKAKPLRVVHLNELPGSAGPAPAVTATDANRRFEIFLSPAQSRLALPPPPAAAPTLLKVKLSSSN
jgi:hypothetical protein